MNKYVAGLLAGTAATVPMTMLMLYIHHRIPPGERRKLPPKQITEKVADDIGAEEIVDHPAELDGATAVSHFGYGAACGGAYAMLSPVTDLEPAVKGTLFGLAVWTGSYMGYLPLFGIRPPATERPGSENFMMISAHVVYGAVLGILFAKFAGEAATTPSER